MRAWSSGDFLLAEDHALIAEVVEVPHDVRGPSSGLWWESADTARARCALALFDAGHFSGVVLAVFSGLTTHEEDRAERIAGLTPVLPVLAKASRRFAAPAADVIEPHTDDTTMVARLRFEHVGPHDEFAQDLVTAEREERLLELIDVALREDEFALHLQPIVSLRDDPSSEGGPLIVEVLIRLPSEDFGLLESHQFLDTAERHGRMPAIDRSGDPGVAGVDAAQSRALGRCQCGVLGEPVRQVGGASGLSSLPGTLSRQVGPAVDLVSFRSRGARCRYRPGNSAPARMLIERGCGVGGQCRHGTGRFDFLRDVYANILKIDGSLIQGASDDIVSGALINGLVHMADTLGMRTVASQVDSTGQLRAVRQLGVDYAQGYHVRRPSHIDEFEFLGCGAQLAARSVASA